MPLRCYGRRIAAARGRKPMCRHGEGGLPERIGVGCFDKKLTENFFRRWVPRSPEDSIYKRLEVQILRPWWKPRGGGAERPLPARGKVERRQPRGESARCFIRHRCWPAAAWDGPRQRFRRLSRLARRSAGYPPACFLRSGRGRLAPLHKARRRGPALLDRSRSRRRGALVRRLPQLVRADNRPYLVCLIQSQPSEP